jgi:hypothetical protein
MAGLITIDDLVAEGVDVDPGHAAALIKRASSVIRLAARGALDLVDSPDAPDYIESLAVTLVRRGSANPMGHQSETLGDYSYSAGTSFVATMELTAREKRNVRQAVGVLGAGSLAMTSDLPMQPSEPAASGDLL